MKTLKIFHFKWQKHNYCFLSLLIPYPFLAMEKTTEGKKMSTLTTKVPDNIILSNEENNPFEI